MIPRNAFMIVWHGSHAWNGRAIETIRLWEFGTPPYQHIVDCFDLPTGPIPEDHLPSLRQSAPFVI